MICYVLALGKQHLGTHVVVGYGSKIFWPGLSITSPDHLGNCRTLASLVITLGESLSFMSLFRRSLSLVSSRYLIKAGNRTPKRRAIPTVTALQTVAETHKIHDHKLYP